MQLDRETGKRHQETANEKLVRKFWENPFIPIGGLLTTGFLCNGLFKFGRRDSAGSQVMMRGRIAAQVLISIFWEHNTFNSIRILFYNLKRYFVKPRKLIFNVIQFMPRDEEFKFIGVFRLILNILSRSIAQVHIFVRFLYKMQYNDRSKFIHGSTTTVFLVYLALRIVRCHTSHKVPVLFKKEEGRRSPASQAELFAHIWYFSFLIKNVTLYSVSTYVCS